MVAAPLLALRSAPASASRSAEMMVCSARGISSAGHRSIHGTGNVMVRRGAPASVLRTARVWEKSGSDQMRKHLGPRSKIRAMDVAEVGGIGYSPAECSRLEGTGNCGDGRSTQPMIPQWHINATGFLLNPRLYNHELRRDVFELALKRRLGRVGVTWDRFGLSRARVHAGVVCVRGRKHGRVLCERRDLHR